MDILVSRIREVQVRYRTLQKLPEPLRLSQSSDIYKLFQEHMIAERTEVFKSILLDSKNQLMCIDCISVGSLNTSVVHPREVFTNAVRLQAASVIFMHNHPSGDCAPSREDRECTQRLIHAGQILGIRVLDHIVFGETDYYSFADARMLDIVEDKS